MVSVGSILGNFQKILRYMIAFVIVFVAWQIGRWLVLPHLQIFPYIPPNPLWEGLYSAILAVSSQIFAFIVLLVIFLWVLYLVIDRFIRYIFPPFSMIIVEIILAMTPFRELKESGLFGLLDDITGTLFSSSKISEKLKGLAKALGDYLYKSLGFTKEIVTEISAPIVSKVRSKTDELTDKITGTVTDTIEGIGTSIIDGGKTIGNSIIESDPLPKNQKATTTSSGSEIEERYLQKNYEQCILERNKRITSDMSGIERAQITVSNSINKTICGGYKIKDKIQLEANKYAK